MFTMFVGQSGVALQDQTLCRRVCMYTCLWKHSFCCDPRKGRMGSNSRSHICSLNPEKSNTERLLYESAVFQSLRNAQSSLVLKYMQRINWIFRAKIVF